MFYRNKRDRFDSHMDIDHGITSNLTFILAGCLMTSEEREVVAQIIQVKYSPF